MSHRITHFERMFLRAKVLENPPKTFHFKSMSELFVYTSNAVDIKGLERLMSELNGKHLTYPFVGIKSSLDLDQLLYPNEYINSGVVQKWHQMRDELKVENPQIAALIGEEYGEEFIEKKLREWYFLWRFKRAGEVYYKLDYNLFKSFEEDIAFNCPLEFVRTPFECLYLIFPESSGFCLPLIKSPLEGAYIVCNSDYPESIILSFMLVKKIEDLDIEEKVVGFECRINKNMDYREFRKEVEEQKRQTIDKDDLAITDFVIKFLDIVIKTALFTTSYNVKCEEIIPDKVKIRPLDDKYLIRQQSTKKYYVAGHKSVTVFSNKKKAPTRATGKGTKHSVRYPIGAHFHPYWILSSTPHNKSQVVKEKFDEKNGKKKLLVKIYVGRYWKGPTYAEQIRSREYNLRK